MDRVIKILFVCHAEGIARRCMTEVAGQIETNRGKDSYFYYGFTTLRKSEKLYDFYT